MATVSSDKLNTFHPGRQLAELSQSALLNLDVSQSLPSAAHAAFESSPRRYSQGAADILELLNAQAALADARYGADASLADWRSARLRLLLSAGVLDRADIKD